MQLPCQPKIEAIGEDLQSPAPQPNDDDDDDYAVMATQQSQRVDTKPHRAMLIISIHLQDEVFKQTSKKRTIIFKGNKSL